MNINRLKNKNEEKNNTNNIMINIPEKIKRLNFFSQKKRQGLSLGNVNKALSIKIKASHSAIE